MKISIVGDVHARWDILNDFIFYHNPDIIISTGDFGFWPNEPYGLHPNCIKNGSTKIYFCDGNHEDHHSLNLLRKKDNILTEIYQNVYHVKRGSVLEIDGTKYGFFGGALSVDRAYRIKGVDWFPEEILLETDINDLQDEQIDVIISHTAPNKFKLQMKLLNVYDSSRDVLDQVLMKYKPKQWYFSHFHNYETGIYRGPSWHCKWTMLNKSFSIKGFFVDICGETW